jgi:hypothetical protein
MVLDQQMRTQCDVKDSVQKLDNGSIASHINVKSAVSKSIFLLCALDFPRCGIILFALPVLIFQQRARFFGKFTAPQQYFKTHYMLNRGVELNKNKISFRCWLVVVLLFANNLLGRINISKLSDKN